MRNKLLRKTLVHNTFLFKKVLSNYVNFSTNYFLKRLFNTFFDLIINASMNEFEKTIASINAIFKSRRNDFFKVKINKTLNFSSEFSLLYFEMNYKLKTR